ncbi:unnamed protein product [Closterium sp. NIES-64]|nr:unnamed protein product [Closterium sp. NIES-64]
MCSQPSLCTSPSPSDAPPSPCHTHTVRHIPSAPLHATSCHASSPFPHAPTAPPLTAWQARQGARWGGGVVPIAEYGSEFGRAAGAHGNKPRKAVRLLYNGSNHYDLLL